MLPTAPPMNQTRVALGLATSHRAVADVTTMLVSSSSQRSVPTSGCRGGRGLAAGEDDGELAMVDELDVG